MLTLLILMTIWTQETSQSLNRLTGGAPAYLNGEDQIRWERLRQSRALYEGRHRTYFLDEQRTQWTYPQARVQGRVITPYVTMNMLKLIANTTADLLFSASPRITADDPQQSARLDELSRRSLLHSRFHEAATQMSWSGGAFLEALLWNGESYVEGVAPDEIYPGGPRMPDGQYERYTRYATAKVGSEQKPITLLLKTTYEPGRITRRLFQLDDQAGTPRQELSLDNWPAFKAQGATPPTEQPTGLSLNTITYVANKAGERLGVNDFDGHIELQDTINAKYLQVAIILAKHAAPKLRAPRKAANNQGNFPASAEVVYADGKDDWGYITWDGHLESAIADRDAAVDALCVAAEMSPMLLGVRRGSSPESARKARLDATKDIARVGRKALIIQPALARTVEVAQRIDQTSSFRRSYPVSPIGVEMRDGMPKDPIEIAEFIERMRAAKAMSLEAAVGAVIEDPDAAATEVERVRVENAAAMPSFFGEPATDTAITDKPPLDNSEVQP